MTREQDVLMLVSHWRSTSTKPPKNLEYWEHEGTFFLQGYRPWLPKNWGICFAALILAGWISVIIGLQEHLSVLTKLGGALFFGGIVVVCIASDVMRQTLVLALNSSIVALYIESRRQVSRIQSWSRSEVAFFWAIRSGGKRPGWLAMRLADGSGVDFYLTGSNRQLRKVADILNARLHHQQKD